MNRVSSRVGYFRSVSVGEQRFRAAGQCMNHRKMGERSTSAAHPTINICRRLATVVKAMPSRTHKRAIF